MELFSGRWAKIHTPSETQVFGETINSPAISFDDALLLRPDVSVWSENAGKRLVATSVVAAILLLCFAIFVRFSIPQYEVPLADIRLNVELLVNDAATTEQAVDAASDQVVDESSVSPAATDTQAPPVEALIEPQRRLTDATTAEKVVPPGAATGVQVSPSTAGSVDWYLEMELATGGVLEEEPKRWTPGGHMQEKKEEAAKRYAPAKRKTEIWGTSERDIYGRTVVNAGKCDVVLDDPVLKAPGSMLNLVHYLRHCLGPNGPEFDLSGIEEIKARRKYLQPLE